MEVLRIEEGNQNKGYGQYFINGVIENIKNQGYQEITIGVEDDNLMLNMYIINRVLIVL